jgi:hypothetical protein
LARIEKTHLQEFLIPPPDLLAFGKNHPTRAKSVHLPRAYRSPNLKVKGREKNKEYERVSDVNVQERKLYKSSWDNLEIVYDSLCKIVFYVLGVNY